MKFRLLLLLLVTAPAAGWAQKSETIFNVLFKGKSIGTMHAVEERTGTKSNKDLRTQTDTKIFAMSIHVESEVKSLHDDGILVQGTSYRHANRGSEDVHAHVAKIGEKLYQKERNGERSRMEGEHISICVIDLYFREPKGIKRVFSNMYAEFVTLKEIGQGKYQLITPDGKDSFYSYKNGKLVSVESNTPLGKVICTRLS